jgi:hypothetical protein
MSDIQQGYKIAIKYPTQLCSTVSHTDVICVCCAQILRYRYCMHSAHELILPELWSEPRLALVVTPAGSTLLRHPTTTAIRQPMAAWDGAARRPAGSSHWARWAARDRASRGGGGRGPGGGGGGGGWAEAGGVLTGAAASVAAAADWTAERAGDGGDERSTGCCLQSEYSGQFQLSEWCSS